MKFQRHKSAELFIHAFQKYPKKNSDSCVTWRHPSDVFLEVPRVLCKSEHDLKNTRWMNLSRGHFGWHGENVHDFSFTDNGPWSSIHQYGFIKFYKVYACTVDRRNPAPVDMVNIPLFVGFYTSQVVQDFFHQQYHKESHGPKIGPSLLKSWLG